MTTAQTAKRRRQLIIFEGPDGGGKTTAAKKWADRYGARYVHLGPFTGVSSGLGSLYVEAMLPALLGYQDVVMDRCWVSEPIYGKVYRDGKDRLGEVGRRMLDRVAMRCRASVFLCLPSWGSVVKSFRARKGEEYLDKEEQLQEVHQEYQLGWRDESLTALPVTRYNYDDGSFFPEVDHSSTAPHPLHARSGGHLGGKVLIVGEAFAEHKDRDPLFQVPFVSFNTQGCSQWLTQQLVDAGIPEQALVWANADDPALPEVLEEAVGVKHVVALGKQASARLAEFEFDHVCFNHPQHAKRFQHHKPYEAVEYITKEWTQ